MKTEIIASTLITAKSFDALSRNMMLILSALFNKPRPETAHSGRGKLSRQSFSKQRWSSYCWRRAGIGRGMLKVEAATPIPPSQVFGGVVQVPLPWHSAAQNVYPSMPAVVPAPAGATLCTQLLVEFWSEALKFTHSGRICVPVLGTRNRLPVSLAGASGGVFRVG